MRVLHVINSLEMGGAEKLLVDSLPFYETKLDIDIAILSSKNDVLKGSIENNGFKGKIIELSDGSVYNPRLIFSLVKEFGGYDIIHVHLFPALYWVVFASILYSKKIKLVYTEHSTNNKRRSNFILKYFDRIIYKKINKIITISDDVDIKLRTHLGLLNSDKIEKIENGINLERIKLALPYSKSNFFADNDILLIQVSSFRFPKDQKTLIHALKLLPEEYKLLLVGEGPDLIKMKILVTELGLFSRVKFLGLRNDVPELLKTVDSIILSSAYEGLSLSCIEGMYSGNPFIASDVQGISGIVKGFGLVFPFGNSEELAKNIVESVDNKDVRFSVVGKCQERAAEFDVRKMVLKYCNLYISLLK